MNQLILAFTDEQVARLGPTFGRFMNLGRDATLTDLEAHLMTYIDNKVRAVERQCAMDAVSPPPFLRP